MHWWDRSTSTTVARCSKYLLCNVTCPYEGSVDTFAQVGQAARGLPYGGAVCSVLIWVAGWWNLLKRRSAKLRLLCVCALSLVFRCIYNAPVRTITQPQIHQPVRNIKYPSTSNSMTAIGPVMPDPIPGLKMKPPHAPPAPGQILLGYQQCAAEPGCCNCDTLNGTGVMTTVILALFCWPLVCLPCVLPSMHDDYQVPVYGYPKQLHRQSMPAPHGKPATGYPTAAI